MTRNKIVARAIGIATAVVTGVIVLAGAALAAGGDGGPIGPGPRNFDGRDGHHGGGILMLVAAVLVAVLITWLIARRSPASRPATAETILSERLARSEISVDDYRTTLAALREASSR